MVFKNNKGFTGVVILILVALFIVALVSVVVGFFFGEMNTMIQTDDDLGNTSKEIVSDLNDRYDNTMDGAFITILGLLFLVGMIAGWVSNDNPYTLIIAIIVMVFILLIAAVMSNTWEEYTDDAELGSYSSNLTITNFVMNNFLAVAVGMIGAIITVMYMRRTG